MRRAQRRCVSYDINIHMLMPQAAALRHIDACSTRRCAADDAALFIITIRRRLMRHALLR